MATNAVATTDTKPPKAPIAAGSALRAFVPSTLDEAWRLSTALASSGMIPKAYGSDPNKVMVGILAGAEVGLTPFAALQSIAVINGNPSLWGDGMLGLVEASGLLEDFKETDDGKEATCWAKRVGRASPVVNTFSMDDAKTAGLLGKQGPWQQYPKRMRKLRARAFTLRDLFSDVIKGIKSAEEVQDYAPMGGGTMTNNAPLTAGMLVDQSRDDAGDPPHNPETGEIGEFEDAGSGRNDGTLAPDNAAAAEGRDDSQRGEATAEEDPLPPYQDLVDDVTERAVNAKILGDVITAENDFAKKRDELPETVVKAVDATIAAARARFAKAGGK